MKVVQAACGAGALLGFAMAEVGVSIQHDANHGAYSRSVVLCAIVVLTRRVSTACTLHDVISSMWSSSTTVERIISLGAIALQPGSP